MAGFLVRGFVRYGRAPQPSSRINERRTPVDPRDVEGEPPPPRPAEVIRGLERSARPARRDSQKSSSTVRVISSPSPYPDPGGSAGLAIKKRGFTIKDSTTRNKGDWICNKKRIQRSAS